MGNEKEKEKESKLAWVLRHRDLHNQQMRERRAEIEAEMDEEEADEEELLQLLTATKKRDRDISEIEFPGDITLNVYTDLTGEQEELLFIINTAEVQRRKGITPDMELVVEAAITLCATMAVPEQGRHWDDVETWRKYRRMTGTTQLLERLGDMLEPYKKRCKKMAGFRKKKPRKKPRSTMQDVPETAEGTDEDDD